MQDATGYNNQNNRWAISIDFLIDQFLDGIPVAGDFYSYIKFVSDYTSSERTRAETALLEAGGQILQASAEGKLGQSDDSLFEIRLKFAQNLYTEFALVYGSAVGTSSNPDSNNLIRLAPSLELDQIDRPSRECVYDVLFNICFQYARAVRSYNLLPRVRYDEAGW